MSIFNKRSLLLAAVASFCLTKFEAGQSTPQAGSFALLHPMSETIPGTSPIDEPVVALLGEIGLRHMSNDGRFVVFESGASNLVANDRNGRADVFVRDRVAKTTTRISLDKNGLELTDHSKRPVISGDGQHVAFHSDAPELKVDGNASGGIYVVDRFGRNLKQACANAAGQFGNQGCYGAVASLSDNGSLIAFESSSSNLSPDDTDTKPDVFVRNLETGAVTLLSHSAGKHGGGSQPVISGNGRYVAFLSESSDLASPSQDASWPQLHIADLVSGSITRPNLSSDSSALDGATENYSFSSDGRFIVFQTGATNVGSNSGGADGWNGVYRLDLVTGIVEDIALKQDSEEIARWSEYPAISADGSHVLFTASREGMPGNDPEHSSGLFLRNMATKTTIDISLASSGDENLPPEPGSWSVSQHGGEILYLTYNYEASVLTVQDPQFEPMEEAVSVPDIGGPFAEANSEWPSVSCIRQLWRTGRYAVFSSHAAGYTTNDQINNFNHKDVFLFDRTRQSKELISVNSDGVQADGSSEFPSISSDGRYVAFRSFSLNMTSDYPDGASGAMYIRDRTDGTTVVGSDDGFGHAMGVETGEISGDGNFLVFSSWNIPSEGAPETGFHQVYRRNLQSGEVSLVSIGVDGLPADWGAQDPVISENGRYVAFTSNSTNLSTHLVDSQQVWLRDMDTGETRLVSAQPNGYPGAGDSYLPCISPDGQKVAFPSVAGYLDGLPNGYLRAFLFDRTSNNLEVLAPMSGFAASNGGLSVSDKSVVFEGSELLIEQDLLDGARRMISADASGNARHAGLPRVSADGSSVVFSTPDRWKVSATPERYSLGLLMGQFETHDFSGAFYDPANSGHGWFFEQIAGANGPSLLAGWYAYRDGDQLWMIGTAPIEGDRATIPMTLLSGGDFPPNFDPASVTTQPFGTLQVVMDDSDHGHATWTSEVEGLGSGEADIIRLSNVSNSAEGDQLSGCHSGSWFNTQQSGHGLQLEVLDNGDARTALAVWYHYLDGEPRWLIGSGPVDGDHADLAMVITHGPDFPPNFDPADKVQEPWGTLRFSVDGANQAQINWDADYADYGDGSMDLTRLTTLDGHACMP